MAEPLVYSFATTDGGETRYRIVDTYPVDGAAGSIIIEEKASDALGKEVWLPLRRAGTEFRVPYLLMLGLLREIGGGKTEAPKLPRRGRAKYE